MNANVYMSYDPMSLDKVFNIVFDMNTRGNFKKLMEGEVIGTLVHA